jgi:hypothetical protein
MRISKREVIIVGAVEAVGKGAGAPFSTTPQAGRFGRPGSENILVPGDVVDWSGFPGSVSAWYKKSAPPSTDNQQVAQKGK